MHLVAAVPLSMMNLIDAKSSARQTQAKKLLKRQSEKF